MGELTVQHKGDDRFAIEVRGHVLYVDQPVADGGEDSAPTPVELFVGSLAACVGHYARRYLRRHDLSSEGLRVAAAWENAKAPARVGSVRVSLTVPGLPEDRREALLAVASHCTVHNSLSQAPEVVVALT